MQPDAILFAMSQYNLSAGKFRSIAARLKNTSELPCMLVRLEDASINLPDALDILATQGFKRILVQPIGLPFSESLASWLPGAVGHWLAAQKDTDINAVIGSDGLETTSIVEQLAVAAQGGTTNGKAVSRNTTRLGKPGWENPPNFTHHLLVCTGPRCHYRDAASLLVGLKAEIDRQGISKKCLTTRTGCMFPCNKGPLVAVYPRGEWYRLPDRDAVTRFVSEVLADDTTVPELVFHKTSAPNSPS